MDKGPDEVRRDPLDRQDRSGETGRDPAPLMDPVGEPGDVRAEPAPEPVPTPGGAAGGAAIDEAEARRVEIERTRTDMGETVDAIQQRLSPENLKEQAKDRVREATVGKAQGAGSSIVETIRANPLPAALTGIGLSWLFVSGRRQRSGQPRYQQGRRYAYDYPPPTYDYPHDYEEERGTISSSAGQALERARDRVGETASQAQDTAGQVASQAQDRAGEVASQAQDTAGQVASQAQNRVRRLGDQARYQARRAGGGFQRMLRENPLSVGTLAVGVGAAVGLAIPETAKEHEVMGEARDNLVEKTQEKAQEAQQKVQSVAQEAQSAAQQEAENQGLTNQ